MLQRAPGVVQFVLKPFTRSKHPLVARIEPRETPPGT